MLRNPIPNELRSDHLFLLIGTNPVPDWVAARLLLRERGKLYLVHSDETLETAKHLTAYLIEKHGYEQPDYVEIKNPYCAADVYQAIKGRIAQISYGTVGLNYTGGTKVMSAHSHRAMDRELPQGGPPAVFSYLEAKTCTMRFDDLWDHEYPIGLVNEAKLYLRELFRLHDEFSLPTPTRKTTAIPVAEELINVHSDFRQHKTWRAFCENNLKYPRNSAISRLGKRPGDFKADVDARPIVLNLSGSLSSVVTTLLQGGATGADTLGDVVDARQWEFKDAEELAMWLDGGWLEHYVTHLIAGRQSSYKVNDYGRNIVARLPRISRKYEFEIDVAAMRGYQLHIISCYSGSERKSICKQKLFEAYTRAQQLGGDQSRAALVCCSDNPNDVEYEVAQDWDLKARVKVFGRRDLKCLDEELQKWFDAGAKEA